MASRDEGTRSVLILGGWCRLASGIDASLSLSFPSSSLGTHVFEALLRVYPDRSQSRNATECANGRRAHLDAMGCSWPVGTRGREAFLLSVAGAGLLQESMRHFVDDPFSQPGKRLTEREDRTQRRDVDDQVGAVTFD
jgi:hypothetical protein